jgi:hypothetical protein
MAYSLLPFEIEAAKQRGDWKQVELLTARYYRIKEERDAEVSRSKIDAIRDRAAALAKLPIDERAKAAV